MSWAVADRRWLGGFVALTVLGSVAYAIAPPHVPDLAAQVARVQAARSGAHLWWTGWFGGLSLPSYSLVSPLVMSVLGVGASAAVAAVAACGAGLRLFDDAPRPRLAVGTFGVVVFADVLGGRVTFALGFAAGAIAVALILCRRPWLACVAGVSAALLSPLAGLFLGLVVVTVWAADRSLRRLAVCLAAALAALAAVGSVLFGNVGRMAFPVWHLLVGLLIVAVVGAVCPNRYIRVASLVLGVALIGFFVIPGPVGTNMIRLLWLTAAPVLAGYATFPPLRRSGVVALTVGALVWPLADLGVQLASAANPAASAAFYTPLVRELQAQAAAAGPTAVGARVEVVDPVGHWSAAYVARDFPIARGWDRQADRIANPLFYDGTLTSSQYRRWLSAMAVRWVALPRDAPLDYAAEDEAALVLSGPSYLRLIWQNPDWDLYQVRHARALITGATALSADSTGVTFDATRPGAIRIQVRWTRYLTLSAGNEIVPTCLSARGEWTTVQVAHPGIYTLAPHFRLDHDDTRATCPS